MSLQTKKEKIELLVKLYLQLFAISIVPNVFSSIKILFNSNLHTIEKFDQLHHIFSLISANNLIISIIAFILYFLRNSFLRLIKSISFILISLITLIDLLCIATFNSHLNSSFYYSIFSTNTDEFRGFIYEYFNFTSILLSIGFIIFSLFIYRFKQNKITSLYLSKLSYLIILLFFFFSCFSFSRNQNNIFQVPIFSSFSNLIEYNRELSYFNNNKNPLEIKVTSNSESPQTHVIIIGESTSKYHMSLYGYNRKTNPKLEKIKELIKFENVETKHVHTVNSLKELLLLKTNKKQYSSTSIIDLLKKANFKTYWISNQETTGSTQSIITSIANSCEEKIFLNRLGNNHYDGYLLNDIKKTFIKKPLKKVIFIHLIGTHLNYSDRYPTHFDKFRNLNSCSIGRRASIRKNEYDNAILYNDQIIYSIFMMIKNRKEQATATYFSDHGDEVFDFRNFHGHADNLKSKFMSHIPFLLYTNNSFCKNSSNTLEQLKSKANDSFTLSEFNYYIQDLIKIKSNHYRSNWTSKISNHGVPIIGCHRTNGKTRLNEVQNKFKILEMDVVFENNELYVRHPPVQKRIKLLKLINCIKKPKKKIIWIDLKNLSSKNKISVSRKMKVISKKLKELIIESSDVKSLSYLEKNKIKTSYYLPDLQSINSISLKRIQHNIKTYYTSYISQSYENIELMNRFFPKKEKITWLVDIEFNNFRKISSNLFFIQKDYFVKYCLVNCKTKSWI